MRVFQMVAITQLICLSMAGASFADETQQEFQSISPEVQSISEPKFYFNQVGYRPSDQKVIVVSDPGARFCSLHDRYGFLLSVRPLQRQPTDLDYQTKFHSCDFSDLRDNGTYYMRIGHHWAPYPLYVGVGIYDSLLTSAVKGFYYQRAGIELEVEYAGIWARPAGHQDHKLTTRKVEGLSKTTQKNVPGGWYDAGDYGKYVVNGGISLTTLLSLYEQYPRAIRDQTGIPESQNGRSDLLDEAKVELDWFLTMQDNDGGVFFKVGPTEWPGFIMPHEDTGERFVTGKSTASTLNFAAVLAQASRIYAPHSRLYAWKLLMAAERAWKWALKNPKVNAPELDPAGTGGYGDEHFEDEFLWAAVQLAGSSHKSVYRDYVLKNLRHISIRNQREEALWWQNSAVWAFIALLEDRSWKPLVQNYVQEEIIAFADRNIKSAEKNPFLIPYRGEDFIWGSNGGMANVGIVLLRAYRLTGNGVYYRAARDILDYLLGRNIHGLSFVTGFGKNSAMHPHHRPSGGDGIESPIPGLLAGGPNVKRNDLASKVKYPENTSGPYCYSDEMASYASNEIAINWNAPLAYLLAGIIHEAH